MVEQPRKSEEETCFKDSAKICSRIESILGVLNRSSLFLRSVEFHLERRIEMNAKLGSLQTTNFGDMINFVKTVLMEQAFPSIDEITSEFQKACASKFITSQDCQAITNFTNNLFKLRQDAESSINYITSGFVQFYELKPEERWKRPPNVRVLYTILEKIRDGLEIIIGVLAKESAFTPTEIAIFKNYCPVGRKF